MFRAIATRLRRCAPTLAQDAAGAGALFVILFGGLHLPLFF